jgi:hypothetical protein
MLSIPPERRLDPVTLAVLLCPVVPAALTENLDYYRKKALT